jgi:hypothetical protein
MKLAKLVNHDRKLEKLEDEFSTYKQAPLIFKQNEADNFSIKQR